MSSGWIRGAGLATTAVAAAAWLCALVAAPPAWAEDAARPSPDPQRAVADDPSPEEAGKRLCALIESAAGDHDLPVGYFTRLIWKESRFRSDAVSPKGAQGIAQFMPGTAAERGLADPFDPDLAIPASAGLLADLGRRFGNLGLAAAAYNAGADRVENWLAERASLPFETQDYVQSVTGLPAESWMDREAAAELPLADKEEDCLTLTARLSIPGPAQIPVIETVRAPWGVQVAGNFSRDRALAAFRSLQQRFPSLLGQVAPMIVSGQAEGRGRRTFFRVRVPAETREQGERLCGRLRAAGGSCVVLKT